MAEDASIWISLNNGRDWEHSGYIQAKNTRHNLSVKNQNSNQCKVRLITEISGDTIENHGVFIIENAGDRKIRIVAPYDKEVVLAGTNKMIQWEVEGAIPEVNLQYSKNQGETWISLGNNISFTGSYEWEVPAEAGDYMLKLLAPCSSCIYSVIGVKVDQTVTEMTKPIVSDIYSVYPNPSGISGFYIDGLDDKEEFGVFDIWGNEIRIETKLLGGKYHIQLPDGISGLFYIKSRRGDKSATILIDKAGQ